MFMDVQIDYLLYLQDFREATGDVFTTFFLQMTKFGEYLLPFSVFAFIYWCIDKRIGIFLILDCGFSMMVNLLIKNIACIYRPWIVDARVKPVESALKYAGGYSFPSGHTTIAVSCWGAIGVFWRRIRGMLPLMLTLCVLVAFSRNYVGVHTLQDVLIAAVIAVAILWLGWRAFCWAEKHAKGDLILSLCVAGFSLLLAIYICYRPYSLDYVDGMLLVEPHKCKLEIFSKLGFVIGGFGGWLLERRFVCFDVACQGWRAKIKRVIGGLIPLFLLLFILFVFCKWLFETQSACFCGLFVISFYITFMYPWFFSHFNQQK